MTKEFLVRLTGRVAIVTGAASGIGCAIARVFAREGARVVLSDIANERGVQVVEEIEATGGEAVFVRTDVTREEEIRNMVQAAVDAFGGIDVLVNNAGGGNAGQDVLDADLSLWEEVVERNLKSVYLCCRAAIPAMIERGGGSIVSISSVNALACLGGFPAYSAAKGGIISLTRVLAVQYGRKDIRVNVICPGTIDTERVRTGFLRTPDRRERTLALYPMGRLGRPEDVAYMALYLASDEAPFTTGGVFVVDGGLTAGMLAFGK